MIEIYKWQEFGERIADWANGKYPRPARVRDLIELIENVDVAVGGLRGIMEIGPGFREPEKLDENITYFEAPNEESLGVLMPHPDDLKKDPPPEDQYILPSFYDRVYGHEPNITNSENFRSERIADYAMRKCV
jgi:hypothetical protein